MMSVRRYRLDNALERVRRVMQLRRPQREALEEVHRLVDALEGDLPALSRIRVVKLVHDCHPSWSFAPGEYPFPQMTFEMATGVGKTRLMGAIMAYLYLSGQSRNFLILAP